MIDLRFMAILLTTFLTSFFLCYYAKGRYFLDAPNERSAHKRPTSRFGGVGIYVGVCVGYGLIWYLYGLPYMNELAILALSSFLWSVGALDDYKHMPVATKLFAQALFAAGGIWFFSLTIPLPESFSFLSTPLVFFFMIAFINASNFSDGLNGLWSGTVILWCLWVLFLSMIGGDHNGFVFLILFASIMGFFVLNFPFGKIFLGDSGSTFLGGMALLTGVCYAQTHAMGSFYMYELLLMVFSPFAFVFSDIGVTLIKRIFQGYHPFVPHKNHFKQKLVHEIGLSHATVTAIYLLGSLLGTYLLGFRALFMAELQMNYQSAIFIFIIIKLVFMAAVQLLSMSMGRRRSSDIIL